MENIYPVYILTLDPNINRIAKKEKADPCFNPFLQKHELCLVL